MAIDSFQDACLIPARIGSTRFPRKPLALISGVPMIVRVAEKASQVFGIEGTYVVTDSDEIEDVSRSSGFSVVRINDDVPTGTDRIALAAAKFNGISRFYNLQGDEPLVSVEDLSAFRRLSAQCGIAVTNGFIQEQNEERRNSQNTIKLAVNDSSDLIYASRSPIPFGMLSSKLQVCMYSFTPDDLSWFLKTDRGPIERAENIEILRFLEHGRQVRMLETFSPSHAVDVPSDIGLVESILAGKANQID